MRTVAVKGLMKRAREAVAVSTLVMLIAFVIACVGCSSPGTVVHSEGGADGHADGDAAMMFDAHDAGASPDEAEAATPDGACGREAGGTGALAQACSCNGDCASGHCVDRVC